MVYHVADAVVCPLGFDTPTVYQAIKAGNSAISPTALTQGTYMLSKLSADQYHAIADIVPDAGLSRFEQLCVLAVRQALQHTAIRLDQEDTALILSTTKGNIEWLHQPEHQDAISIPAAAARIAACLKYPYPVQSISIACISGAAAQVLAKRLLDGGRYRHAVIVGCDLISDFVLAGFQSFQALSDERCRPFDAQRKGLNLGEAAACMVLSSDPTLASGKGVLQGGAISNDANHLSGPSKTGAELGTAIRQSLDEAQVSSLDIGFISAHGTATNYNDEMEAKAIHLAGLGNSPVHSLKPYFGHTLGASGLLESIISIQAMGDNTLLPIPGFTESNTSVPLHIISTITQKPIAHFVKTAAGFGGCNAALVWSKTN